jgi:hypothetical protein
MCFQGNKFGYVVTERMYSLPHQDCHWSIWGASFQMASCHPHSHLLSSNNLIFTVVTKFLSAASRWQIYRCDLWMICPLYAVQGSLICDPSIWFLYPYCSLSVVYFMKWMRVTVLSDLVQLTLVSLNYDCHCQHFKLHLVFGCLFLAFDGVILTVFVFVSISPWKCTVVKASPKLEHMYSSSSPLSLLRLLVVLRRIF